MKDGIYRYIRGREVLVKEGDICICLRVGLGGGWLHNNVVGVYSEGALANLKDNLIY